MAQVVMSARRPGGEVTVDSAEIPALGVTTERAGGYANAEAGRGFVYAFAFARRSGEKR